MRNIKKLFYLAIIIVLSSGSGICQQTSGIIPQGYFPNKWENLTGQFGSNIGVPWHTETGNMSKVGYFCHFYRPEDLAVSELGTGGTPKTISSLRISYKALANVTLNNLYLYIKNTMTNPPSASMTYPGTDGWTCVLNNKSLSYTIETSGTAWCQITFDTPFVYDGTSGIALLFEKHEGTNGLGTFFGGWCSTSWPWALPLCWGKKNSFTFDFSQSYTYDFDGIYRVMPVKFDFSGDNGCTAPQLKAKANNKENIFALCPRGSSLNVSLSANPSVGSGCDATWQYSWYNGEKYWDGADFTLTEPLWDAAYENISVISKDSVTYTVKAQCSNNGSCSSESSATVVILKDAYNVNAVIGNPANGSEHHLYVTWDKVLGAHYNLQYSTDKTNWVTINEQLSTINYFDHNTGDYPNSPAFYRVKTYLGSVSCDTWIPMPDTAFTACDFPVLTVNNPSYSGLEINLENDNNPSYTLYSIKCQTTGQFVHPDGTLAADEVFLTKAAWNLPVKLTNLNPATNYCFYASAKNRRDDIRTEGPVNTVCATTLDCLPLSLVSQTAGQISRCVGDTATIKVVTLHATSFQWDKSGAAISGATNSVLSFSSLVLKDYDIYRCIISNKCSSVTSEYVMLKVNSKPLLNVIPIILHKAEGESINFSISPTGSDSFSFQWQKDGAAISGATSDHLALNNLTLGDAGVYSCRVSNECGFIIRTIATIIIGTNKASLYGLVIYDNTASAPLSNVDVTIKNTGNTYTNTSQSDTTGYYVFISLNFDNYIISAYTTKKWGGGNPLDALIVNRYFTGLITSFGDELKKKAADVNNDNKINPTDALLINRRYIGLINSFAKGDWIFETDTIQLNTDMQYNFKGICVGDVNGDYSKIP